MDAEAVEAYLTSLQDQICGGLEAIDGSATFATESGIDLRVAAASAGFWPRVMSSKKAGELFSRGGRGHAGISYPAPSGTRRAQFSGHGVSLVIHPRNPHAPTSHANVRMFMAEKPGEEPVWWMGGGFDLTPYYGYEEDAVHWHATAKAACDPFGDEVYPRLKKWCDDYFYLPHRQEPRGVGGLFYDDLNEWGFEQTFSFMRSVGDGFLKAYAPILERRMDTPWTEPQRQWQLYRRGRYVEFNLVHDRGTLFGLQTNGRTEAILMSLPPLVRWEYGHTPEEGTPEAALMTDFLRPRDWLGVDAGATAS